MSFKAFGFNLTSDHTELIKRMVANITDEQVEVTDVRSFEPEVTREDIVLAYGLQAQRKLQGVRCGVLLEFPDPDRLDMTLGDPEEIRLAQEKLTSFGELLDIHTTEQVHTEEPTNTQSLNLTTEEIPANLTASDVKKLEEQQFKQGRTHWTGMTRDGRSIRVTVEPEENTADINITFAELYAVMGLVETLRVKELEFVYKPSAVTRKSSTQ